MLWGASADSPLCRSLLSGSVAAVADLSGGAADKRPQRYPRFLPENIAKNASLVAKLEALAEQRGLTTAQLSLSWVASQGDDVVPIPGTTKVKNLHSNVAAQSDGTGELSAVPKLETHRAPRANGDEPML
jgi:aryl-alcohol dehydrogenase-like predicted oxidoreductase